MKEKVNRFWRLGGGHTTLMSYHSHRGYFKALNCGNSDLIVEASRRVFRFFGIFTNLVEVEQAGILCLEFNQRDLIVHEPSSLRERYGHASLNLLQIWRFPLPLSLQKLIVLLQGDCVLSAG